MESQTEIYHGIVNDVKPGRYFTIWWERPDGIKSLGNHKNSLEVKPGEELTCEVTIRRVQGNGTIEDEG